MKGWGGTSSGEEARPRSGSWRRGGLLQAAAWPSGGRPVAVAWRTWLGRSGRVHAAMASAHGLVGVVTSLHVADAEAMAAGAAQVILGCTARSCSGGPAASFPVPLRYRDGEEHAWDSS